MFATALLLVILAVSLVLPGCVRAPEPPREAPKPAQPAQPQPQRPKWWGGVEPLSPAVKVRAGLKGVPSDGGVLIAKDRGYFQDMGLDVEILNFNSGQEIINPMAAGHLDVGLAVTDAALFNAILRGLPIKIVADKGTNIPKRPYYHLVVRKDLQDKIKDYKDLNGRKLAVVGTGSLDEICLDRVLKKGGMSTKGNDIDLVVIKAFPDMLAAMANKSIDGAMLIEPFIVNGVEKDICVRWKDPSEYEPDAQIAIVIYGPSMTSKPEVAKRFMMAYLKALRDYNDAFIKNKGVDAMIDTLCRVSLTKDPALYRKMNPAGLNPNGYVKVSGIDADLAWYKDRGLLKGEIKAADVVDHQYVEFALKAMGKYE
ncbi:MAG: ABC transporter substrate-binding protein [Firmicutes bacterium]|nr:ABC transporter substrate-binding protein [Bacillota bacterium]